MSINQISIFLENRTGQLAEITGLLAKNNINLRAISIAETADYGVLRVIVDDSAAAAKTLFENGCVLSMTPVLAVAVPDKPAGLNELLEILAEGEIAIDYMYSLLAPNAEHAYMIFRVQEEAKDKFVSLLGEHNISLVSAEELGIK